ILILGIRSDQRVIAITLPPEAPAAKAVRASGPHEAYGALFLLPLSNVSAESGLGLLMREICSLSRRRWVDSRRLDRNGVLVPCRGSNCGGNTLEASLGIKSNGIAAPDFHGWEVKARTVPNADAPGRSVVTLFTPEPS